MKILLIEDDSAIAALLSETLTAHHYTVDIATDGQTGLSLATDGEYELILLDLLIPKLDGISLCRRLRSQNLQKPILLLTAKNSSADVVQGLDAGADDYLTKPCDLSELLARIRALLRRGETKLAPTMLTWGDLSINPVSAEVFYAQQSIGLSPKEYALLVLFLRNPQRAFSRSEIIDRLWSINACPGEGTVTNLIKDLRHKLKAAGIGEDLLETVYGMGYRLRTAPSQTIKKPFSKVASREERSRSKETEFASVRKVLARYQDTFAARIDLLEQAAQAALSQQQQYNAAQEAHKLTGALGSFGYEVGSELTRSIEHLLMQEKPLNQADRSQLSTWITQLKQELAKPPFTTPSDLAEFPRVLVIDDRASFTEQLRTDAADQGLCIETVAELSNAKPAIVQTNPQAILFNLTDKSETDLALLSELKAQFPAIPVVAISEHESLRVRVAASRLGAQKFLNQAIAPAEIFEVIKQVLPKAQRLSRAKVMLVDDDSIMLGALSDLLDGWGLQVTSLQDPEQFWQTLSTIQPDVLVMDLEMPTLSGIDLCRVVRQDARWNQLPILVVTAHTDADSIQRVFAAGADDFISKSLIQPEFVPRVISRIDRSRLQTEMLKP